MDKANLCCLVAQSYLDYLQPRVLKHARLPFWSLLKLMSIDAIQPCHPFTSPSVFPIIKVFSRVDSSHQVAQVLEIQHQSFQ